MSGYEKFMVVLAAWTLFEGACVVVAPHTMGTLARKLFPWSKPFFEETPPGELRKLGALEFAFGALLSIYLVWRL